MARVRDHSDRARVAVGTGRLATRLALLAGSAVGLATAGALGGPAGEQVVAGQASFARAGNLTTITAGYNAVINYRSFDISAAESVRFIQPSATARVLNRIQSGTPTRIDGALTANGIVYLVNPAGVMFGRTSVVDVAGLYAAAGRLSDSDFLAGVNHFTELSGNITTDGLISAHDAALVARRIENTGRIISDGGLVTMVIGNDVYVRESGRRMYVRIDGVDVDPGAAPAPGSPQAVAGAGQQAGIRNSGTISSPGGLVTLGAGDGLALAIHNSGTIIAKGGSVAASTRSGTVRNDGTIDVSVSSGSAGSVTLQGPMVAVSGRIDAGAAQGAGGSISLSSSVGTVLDGNAVVTAAGGGGLASGGTIVIKSGGDTFVGKLVRVDISGGAGGGDGGYLDLSAGRRLGVYGVLVGTAAAGYKPALVLFDPDYLLIARPGTSDGQLLDGTVLGGDSGPVFVVSPEAIQNFAGDVRLEARIDLGIVASLDKINGGLYLYAGRDIRLGSLVGPGVCGATYGGSCAPALTVRAGSIDFHAGGSIRDYANRGTNLESTSGNISLVGETGVVQYGLLTVPSRGGVTIRQANSLVFDPRRLRSAGPIALSLDVTAGSLSFQGSECGGGTAPVYLTLDAHASGNVAINVPLVVLQDASISSNANVNIGADVRAGGALLLHAGQDGTGNLSFTRCGLDIGGQTITLLAGNGSGSSARVDARTNSPVFRGAGGGATRPDAFAIIQDASIGDASLPRASQFGAPIAGMAYALESRGGGVSLSDPSLLRGTLLTLTGATGTTINGPLDLGSLLVQGPARLGANVTTSLGQTYTGPVVLVADVDLTGTTLRFEGPMDSASGREGLVIHGALHAEGPIGGGTPLESLVVFGPADLCSGLVVTELGQHYVGDVTLCRDTVLTSLSGADVRFDARVDGTPGGAPEALTINGGLIANGAIGSRDPLGGLSVSGLARLNGGEVATRDGGQTYSGGALIGANLILSNIGDGAITLAGNVDAAPGVTPTLVIQGALMSSADIGLNGPLGSLQVLGPGQLCGHIVTVGGQNYGPIVLCGDLTTESTSGAEITFNTIDATKGGAMESLHVIGAAIFGGRVGGVEPLGSLTVDGRTEIDTLGIRTFGDQNYNGDVVIGKNTVTLESVNNGTVHFGGLVDGIPGRPLVGLTILGNMHADGPIGSIQPLEYLDVSGATEICGGLIRTVGGQTYGGDVTLCQDTTLESTSGGTITFDAAVDGTSAGQQSLTILGDLVANGPIGGSVPLEAFTVHGDSTLNGGLVRTQGDQTYDGSVALGVDTTLQSLGGGTVLFTGPVDTAPGADPAALVIDANLHAEGPLGATSPLASLSVTGLSEICGGLIRTVAGQTYGGDVTLCQDTTMRVGTVGYPVRFDGRVDGTHPGQESLTIDGDMQAQGPIGGLVPLEFLTVLGTSLLEGGLVRTQGDQAYAGPVTLRGPMTMESLGGGTAHFGADVEDPTGSALTILGNLVAEGAIGRDSPLGSLSISGASEISGGLVRTHAGQTYGGRVALGQDAVLESLGDGVVHFAGPVDSADGETPRALTVLGNMHAEAPIGGMNPLASLDVSGDSEICGGSITTIAGQFYGGHVYLCQDTVLTSTTGGVISFADAVDAQDGNNASLTIRGILNANGPIGGTDPLGFLEVFGAGTLGGGLVRTNASQTYHGEVALASDMLIQSLQAGVIRFDAGVDSAGGAGGNVPRDLIIEISPIANDDGVTRGRIEFGGDLGGVVGLRDIRLCTGGDEIAGIPVVATIVGLNSISIHARDFVMCPLEKFTTLGDLAIDASRRAVLGDLVTVGDMAVRSASIELQRRHASGLMRAGDGTLVQDRGLDFVAGGEMVFTGSIALPGSGPYPTFSSGSGAAPASLGGFEFTRTPDGDASHAALIFEGVVLDQRTRGTTVPPGPPEDVKAALAGAVQPPRFRDSVRPRAFDLGAMARLGLEARPVTPEEAQSALHGRYIYNDLPQSVGGFAAGERTFAGTRVDLGSVLRAVDRYNALNRVPGTTGTALHPVGRPVPVDQLQESAKVIAEAADRFRALTGGWDPGAFRDYLNQTPSEEAARRYVQTLAELVSTLRGMGLPVVEFERSRAHLLGGLADATGMPVPELLKLVEPVVKADV